jgi:hypothetical protein
LDCCNSLEVCVIIAVIFVMTNYYFLLAFTLTPWYTISNTSIEIGRLWLTPLIAGPI